MATQELTKIAKNWKEEGLKVINKKYDIDKEITEIKSKCEKAVHKSIEESKQNNNSCKEFIINESIINETIEIVNKYVTEWTGIDISERENQNILFLRYNIMNHF